MSDLIDAITESIHSQAERALEHFETDDLENASAIINEWTTDSGESILTHHYLETISDVKDVMIYSFVDENSFGYGRFTFDPEAELPVD